MTRTSRLAGAALALPLLLACATEPPLAPVAAPAPVSAPVRAPAAPTSLPPSLPSAPTTPLATGANDPLHSAADLAPADAGPKAPDPRTRSWSSHWPTGWTDPRVVKALAESCDFTPVTPPQEGSSDTPEDVFACKLPYEQACMVTECREESDACDGTCEDSCGSCSASCTTQCGTCESACKDAACKLACGQTTAQCKQACARKMDRCASGTCAVADKACGVSHEEAFQAHGCRARCDKHDQCYNACAHVQDSTAAQACQARCDGALDTGFSTCTVACKASGKSPLDVAKCENACWLTSPCNLRSCNMGG